MMLTVAIYLFCQMTVVWLIAYRLKNPSIVDVAWSVGIMVAAGLFLFSSGISGRNIFIFSLVVLWAVRLAGYILFTRIIKGHVDKRYLSMSESWKMNRSAGFYLNFQFQALLSWIVAIVFIFPGNSLDLTINLSDAIAALCVLTGVIGETFADHQLNTYKRTTNNGVCNIGLWRYSRHPNYFFEWITWCGFFIFALRSEYGYLAVISPALLYVIFNYITGPMTERGSLESRGERYRDYMKTTPMFWPKFRP
jgi:steroid 5-alpha reductase family enzyme